MDWELEQRLREQEEQERRREAERNAIRAEIYTCEEQREKIQTKMRQLQEKIDLQQQEKGKFEQGTIEYEAARRKMGSKLEEMAAYGQHIKMVVGHENIQGERVTGTLAENNIQRLECVLGKINMEITRNKEQWEKLRIQLIQCNNRIESLEEKLRSI